jgi:hypothetical protein
MLPMAPVEWVPAGPESADHWNNTVDFAGRNTVGSVGIAAAVGTDPDRVELAAFVWAENVDVGREIVGRGFRK